MSLTAVFVVLIPAVVELSRAARSFEKLCETIDRDLPPTLESLRQTTAEIARLTDDVNAGVQNAGRVAQHVDQSVSTVRTQAKRAQVSTRSLMAGVGAAWATFTRPDDHVRRSPTPAQPVPPSAPPAASTPQTIPNSSTTPAAAEAQAAAAITSPPQPEDAVTTASKRDHEQADTD